MDVLGDIPDVTDMVAHHYRGKRNDIAVSKPNIFVIDDDASVRKALQRLIRTTGMLVRTFASAEEFLDANLSLPDCLVLDVRLPGMSGLELQKRLAADKLHVPIVFITAHNDEEARALAMTFGAVDFFHKPVEDHVLLEALSRAVCGRGNSAKTTAPN